MPMRQHMFLKVVSKSWLKCVNIVAIVVMILFIFHFCKWTSEEENNVYETWWVWEMSEEGTTKTIKPIEWGETADNSKVMGIIDFKPQKPANMHENAGGESQFWTVERKLLNTASDRTSNRLTIQHSDTVTKRIVLLQKRAIYTYPRLNQTLCGKCTLSYDIDDVRNADAVVIDHGYAQNEYIPKRRSQKQIYVWMNRHSPYQDVLEGFSSRKSKKLDNIFNLTMTHRRDSDIYYPSFTLYNLHRLIRQNSTLNDLSRVIGMKTKFVYWKPLQCGDTTVSKMALDIVYQLTFSGLKVDYYGRCRQSENIQTSRNFGRYKFYLAFGNAWHCRDYFSTDIWKNAFSVGAVPVIWGPRRKDVESFLPPNSYIFLEDFASAFEFTNYIDFLHDNDDELREYLSWREKSFEDLFPPPLLKLQSKNGFCQLCSKLHNLDPKQHYSVPPLRQWWLNNDSSYCVNPKNPVSNYFEFVWWFREDLVLKTHFCFSKLFCKTSYFCIASKFIILFFIYMLYRQFESCQRGLHQALNVLTKILLQSRMGYKLKKNMHTS